ncbi:HesB/IscA family protein [Marichromatium bheemlicum]|uniref:Iron-sulfur cluster assembly accessory protein n=1 Tax=Marichromatium bheemlicum TaxID=365339 RepID=A0ABX1IC36_9GAMM|nr:iron-sulfur cluster assembly accessory protein [Marichromatium bheemlicum]NKN34466.1 iron-sulfur cluster assembly accessory protein [Marichromatium bheemlicum]
MFRLTTAAARQVLEAAREGGTEGLALRLAAYQGPDGGIDYRMGFDEVGEEDIRFQTEGIEVCMAPEYVPLLDAVTMDYVELEPGQFHFIFLNPRDPHYRPPTED